MYQPRTYRHWVREEGLVSFHVAVRETDLYLRAQTNLEKEALKAAIRYRTCLEQYIASHHFFLTALEPVDVEDDAPQLVRDMTEAARKVGVGPMAAVAGAIAEAVGRELMALSPEVIVENGGDIFIAALKTTMVGVYAGDSPFTGRIALEIEAGQTPLGVCTSSGTVGHSLSFGRADAVILLSPSTALADAAATAIGNIIQDADDISSGIDLAQNVEGLTGVVIMKGDRLGVWGDVKIVSLQQAIA